MKPIRSGCLLSRSNELFALGTYQIAGINVANTTVNTALDTLNLTDPKAALIDLIELNRVEGQQLYSFEVANDAVFEMRVAA